MFALLPKQNIVARIRFVNRQTFQIILNVLLLMRDFGILAITTSIDIVYQINIFLFSYVTEIIGDFFGINKMRKVTFQFMLTTEYNTNHTLQCCFDDD